MLVDAVVVLGCGPRPEPARSDSATLTVRLSADIKAQLAKLAGSTHRAQSVLGAEAIAAYVRRELAVTEAIERGRADIRAERVTDHADVMRDTRAMIEAAHTAK